MESAPPPPSGTVTFLFTDIEGSTRLWEQYPEAMEIALARHDALAAAIVLQHAGTLIKQRGEGDSLFAVFARATDAVAAAAALQRALCAEPWRTETPMRVRVALHTGEAALRESDYYGAAVNRCARLRAVAHGAQVLLSQTTCDLIREQLPAEASLADLGSHRLKDLQQPEHVYRLLHPELPSDFPPLRSLEAFTHNLPAQLTSFIGREQEMGEVKQFLAMTRLLTLTGSGGCGKTRLALQVAADVLEEYGDGVWLVELAPLADPALVPQTVASALGVREEPGRPLTATLTDYLRGKQALLVLDNCEHVLTACAQLADTLLRACPKLRMLASSREGLGIGGERTYRVPSLSLPQPRNLPPVARLTEYEAVRLFVERAVFTQPSFAITGQNAAAVVQVCERLDGIPLAIELAAARVRVLPVEQIHARLDDMFRLLTGGSRTALPRQQTLRATIDWSFDLLSEPERTLLRRLSVFAGGWTLAAAEAVCEGESIETWEVLDLLTSLVDKSLVAYDDQATEGRYRLLETMRQYAQDRLMETGGAAAVQGRHALFFLELAERAEPELEGAAQVEWLDRLDAEVNNVRAALAWSQTAPDGDETGVRLAAAIGLPWAGRGYLREGRRWLDGVLARSGPQARTRARAKALWAAASLATLQGELTAALPLAQESAALWQELGERRELGRALCLLGFVEQTLSVGLGRARVEESARMAREVGDRCGLAASLCILGKLSYNAGDLPQAASCVEEGLSLSRQAGDTGSSAGSLILLGEIARLQGDHARAAALNEESWALARAAGNKPFDPPQNLGWIALNQGDAARAQALFTEGLALARDMGNRACMALCVAGLGGAAGAHGEAERGARLLGAAAPHLEQPTGLTETADQADRERSLAQVRAALGEEAFAAAWAEGQALTLEEAIEHALAD